MSEIANAHLRFALSGGAEGTAPRERIRAFSQSGYVVFRDPPDAAARPGRATHLLQTAAFHSRAHKHADDQSFVWFDRGRMLLVDPGRYGYIGRTEPGSDLHRQGFWYADPRRVYVERTRAHNTVEIDGADHERVGVRPYGSGVTRWGEQGRLLWAETRVRHRGCILHTRLLVLEPGQWLLVFDVLNDTRGEPHDYVQRLHFAPDLEVSAHAAGLSAAVPGEEQRLHAVALLPATLDEPVRGREGDLLGWVSPAYETLVPTWVGAYSAARTPNHVFATLLCFADAPPSADVALCRANVTGRRARLAWHGDAGAVRLDLDREGPELELRVR